MHTGPSRARPAIGRRPQARAVFAAVAGALALAITTLPAGAAPAPAGSTAGKPARFTATPLTPVSRAQSAKAPSARLARSDQALLRSTSAATQRVVVKLDYDALASYRGGIKGYAATSPGATGRRLNARGAAERAYTGYVTGIENRFLGALRAAVPAARPGQALRTVYGGVSLSVPANRAKDLLKLPGVVAVQRDAVSQPLTDSSPEFIGAPTIYNQLGGMPSSGKGVIVADLDTGVWPEHPSFRDTGNLPAPPAKGDGTARVCEFGDNPLTPASDPFACNNKLISGQNFLDTYNAQVPGEVYATTARDSDGHGTHTTSTAAGDPVDHANPLGVDRGPINGIAPAAHVAVYKVCGAEGCFGSDTSAATGQAILDGARVINYSISGGDDPYGDATELAFLDAYEAGVLVSASAGNSGPGAATSDHAGPWVTTVGASFQSRQFESTVTLTSPDGATIKATGTTITAGTGPLPVVDAADAPYSAPKCDKDVPAGLFTGKIVICIRGGNARVNKGYRVFKGGAAGMILVNPVQQDQETDNHWLPAIHVDGPAGLPLIAFVHAHPGTVASWPQGEKVQRQGDVMAAFSSRGPLGNFIKPDVTAPGVQILAGHTPTPDTTDVGPPGNYYQAIAGTSMSAPHVTGAAALLFALHPDWTPGQVKSALMTTAKTTVTKEDGTTPADPFDMGGGRIDLTRAGDPGLTFDETATRFRAAADRPLENIDLNLPSVNAPTFPGEIHTTRVAKNVTNKTLAFTAKGSGPAGTTIAVVPPVFTVKPGGTVRLHIVIAAPTVADGQYFGRIDLQQLGGSRKLHLPVAFNKKQGDIAVTQTCDPATIAVDTGTSTCTVSVQNNSRSAGTASAVSAVTGPLRMTGATGATKLGDRIVVAQKTLAGREPAAPTIAPGESPAGYLPLDQFGIAATKIGDEDALAFNVPAFTYAGDTYSSIRVTSDGYLTVTDDNQASATPQQLPNPAPPNGVLAPFWTDLDGTNSPGVYVGTLSDSSTGQKWTVVEWRVNVFGTTSLRTFQVWLGNNGTEDVSFTYPAPQEAPPAALGLTVGAENAEGNAGQSQSTPPAGDIRVTSTPGAAGGNLTYSFTVKGVATGTGDVATAVVTPQVRGTTIDVDKVTVQ